MTSNHEALGIKSLSRVLLSLLVTMTGLPLVTCRARHEEAAKESTPAGLQSRKSPVVIERPKPKGESSVKGPEEETMRLNNLGIAEMEQFHFARAAEYFQKARNSDPDFLAGAVNYGIALFYDRRNSEAVPVLREVVASESRQIQARFVLALLARAAGSDAEALDHLRIVLDQDPGDVASQYLAGTLEAAQHRWDRAIRHFQAALARDPLNVSAHYALAKALIQMGDAAQAEKIMARFQELKARGIGTSFGNRYLEQGRYSEVIQVSVPGGIPGQEVAPSSPYFVDAAASSGIRFVHSGPKDVAGFPDSGLVQNAEKAKFSLELVASYGSGAAFGDFDGDGWPDIALVNSSSSAEAQSRLYRNNHDGTFQLVTASGVEYRGEGMGVAAGDFDNDGRPDIFIAGFQGSSLFHNEGKGKFREVTGLLSKELQQSWALTPAFVDLDHDGDLDLYVACARNPISGKAGNLLYRNNGNGTFTETGSLSGTARSRFAASLAIMDFNNSRDIDLLLLDPPGKLFSNNRDGTFSDVSSKAAMKVSNQSLGVAVGDFDADGRMDILQPASDQENSAQVFWNQGASFESKTLPIASNGRFWNAHALDFDNDGDLDVLLLGSELRLLENTGLRNFQDRTVSTGLDKIAATNARSVAVADYDRDGDLDLLVTRCGLAPLLLRNEGGNRNRSFRLSLRGKADNRFGVGAKVEWGAGGLWQHREVSGNLGYLSQSCGEMLLGLGRHKAPDYVRVLWPSGILQTEVPPKETSQMRLAELDRKGTSCPILYAWDGAQYRFVTDFLGGSATGYLVQPGHYATPDTDEYVKIGSDQLRPRGNRLSLKMVNQLEEVILIDMARLLAVDHPAEIEVFPNERLLSRPPFPEFKILTASSPKDIASASDDKGNSWGRALAYLDRNYVKGFDLIPFKGYAEEHSLNLDLGDLRHTRRTLLLLDGWIDYATSSSNFAASQAGLKLVAPYLQVWDSGKWRTVLEDMGFPAGLPKTITVDLSGKIPLSEHARIRIVTNMRIYWDRIRLETDAQDTRVRISALKTAGAATSWVGYPRAWSPDGRVPFLYEYTRRDPTAPWKTHAGVYTQFGDVQDLLQNVDDLYVVLAHGEAIAADFSTDGLPPLPPGWKRDWLLHADGFGKDMDLHSEYPETVEPLPRHRDLPYKKDSWIFARAADREDFRKRYLVRSVVR